MRVGNDDMTRRSTLDGTAVLWSLRGLDGLSLFRSRDHKHRYPPHFHDFYVIANNEHHGCFCCEGRDETLEPNTFAVINPRQVHGWDTLVRPHVYRACYVDPSVVERLMPPRGMEARPRIFPRPVVREPSLTREFRKAHRALEQGRSRAAPDDLLDLIHRLFSRHAHLDVGRGAELRWEVASTLDYIDREYARSLSLDDLAGRIGLSRFHLVRIFKEELAITPYRYLLQVRVEKGKALIRAGEDLADVALQVGFSHQSHFTEHFRRLVGVTPGAYARAPRAPI